MNCPFCGTPDTKVIDSRLNHETNQVRRRRECLQCQARFSTYETAELAMPRIVKRDGRRDLFEESKLRAGILRALEKRPVSTEKTENSIQRILHRLRSLGEGEISSQLLGEWVMEELLSLDEVAYVRFASVYRSFQDLEAFRKEITRLKTRSSTFK